ncbi:MAG TPA: serine/threonine-protein kinase [Gemmatimonadaceae bacterium]|nr:serine/threonine-protein kinase [Gemmatimonadaceae bacterium]
MTEIPAVLRSAVAERYAIERELGRGGMATVYLAHDLKHERPVALKVLRRDVAMAMGAERFLREIKFIARLQHPHILPLYDSGDADGTLYYVMPWVEGESLRDRLSREGPLPFDVARRIAIDIGDALTYAHAQNVVHRDIKPENILLSQSRALVADFGIARAIVRAAGTDTLTQVGYSLGTPAYMSPEQAAGETEIDGRTDIYSLGCVFYEMLAGTPAFAGPTTQAVLRMKMLGDPPTLRVVRPDVPAPAVAAVERALARAPDDRFATGSAFVEALEGPRAAAATGPAASKRARTPTEIATDETLILATGEHHQPGRARLLVAGIAIVAILAATAALIYLR